MTRLWVLATTALFAALLAVAGGAHAQLEPDLAVTELTTDEAPAPGASVRIQATIANDGGGSSGDYIVNFTVDGEQVGEPIEDSDMASEGSETYNSTAPWTAEAGTHTIGVTVDHDDGGIDEEQNKENNADNRTYTIGPDLEITSFQADPAEIVEGEDVELTATVENVADPTDVAPNASTFKVGFPIDGQSVLAPVSVEGLDAGESTTVSRTWTTTEGDHGEYSVAATADTDDQVEDRDRSNNDADASTVQVRRALADLVVGAVTYSPDPAEPDRQVTFTAQLRNNGQTDAGSHNVSLVVGDETVDETTVDGLAEGAERNATLTWTAEAGHHDVEIRTDVGEAVDETNEDNNAWTLTLPVGPDLLPRELDIQPPEPRAGDRVRFTAEIANDGLAVDRPFQVSFAVDGTPIDTVDMDGLDAGEARNVTSIPWNASTGDHDVSVIVDPEDAIDEVDRTNNQLDESLTVGEPRPNIAVLSASIDPAAPEDGETVTVRANVENAGGRDADAFTVRGQLDGEEIGEVRVDGLETGKQTTLDLGEWTAATGDHELEIVADTDDELTEDSEEDNRFVRRIGIGADLDLLELSVSPMAPEPGEDVTAFALAQNNGSVTVPGTNVSFHVDGDRIGTVSLDELGPNEQGSAELTFTAARSGTLEARLDADDAVDEYDEENNHGQTAIELASDARPPDLTVRSVTIDGDVTSDDTVRFTAEIANEGEGPSPEALVAFRVDGETLGGPVSVDGLRAGASANVTSEAWEPSGERELEVVVDPEDRIGEADETNNAFTRSIEASTVGVPASAVTAVLGLLAASLAARWTRGRKGKP